MKTFLRTTTLTALLFALSFSVTAQQRANQKDRPRGNPQECMERPNANPGNRFMGMIERLDLSDEQKEQVLEIHVNGQQVMLPLKNQMGEKLARLRTLTTSETYDETAVKETIDSIAELRADMMLEQATHHQEIRSLLNDEQRIKFDSFKLGMQGTRLGQ
jgi:Spy/CpxP family protein refolding chaperone